MKYLLPLVGSGIGLFCGWHGATLLPSSFPPTNQETQVIQGTISSIDTVHELVTIVREEQPSLIIPYTNTTRWIILRAEPGATIISTIEGHMTTPAAILPGTKVRAHIDFDFTLRTLTAIEV